MADNNSPSSGGSESEPALALSHKAPQSSEGNSKDIATEEGRGRKKRRIQNELWSFTRSPVADEPVRDKHYHEILYCGRCRVFKTTSTLRFQSHLTRTHHIKVEIKPSSQKAAQTQTLQDILGRQAERQQGRNIEQEKQLLGALRPVEFKEALARLITVRNLPHSLVTFPEFQACMLAINHCAEGLVAMSRNAVPQLIRETFHSHRAALREKLLGSLSWIHFSIDMWTAPSNTAYQAIVASFVDAHKREKATALLSLREFKGTHSGDAQAQIFLEVIREYGIPYNQIGFFTMDNATSNDAMLRRIAKSIPGFDPVCRRIRCNGHILNLAAQTFLFGPKNGKGGGDEEEAIELSMRQADSLSKAERDGSKDRDSAAQEWRAFGALGHLHNLVVWFRSSTERYQDFVRTVGRAIPLDNDTRWNSWFDEIDVALKYRKELVGWINDNYQSISKDALSFEHWEELAEVHSFLAVFKEITKSTEGESNTLDQMLSSMDFLVTHFRAAQQKYEANPRMTTRILASWFKFDKYYKLTDDSPVYVAAILLHPSLRQAYLQVQWAQQEQYIGPAIEGVRKMWEEHYKQPCPGTVKLDEKGKNEEATPLELWRKRVYGCGVIEEEFDHFIGQTPIPIPNQTALQWWLDPHRQTVYPALARMAGAIFSIPPMSAGPERVFSGARRTVSWERVQLGASMVEMTECIKSWTRIPPGRQQSLLAGAFRACQAVDSGEEGSGQGGI